MSSSLEQAFARKQSGGRAALIPYITAGFPDSESTLALMKGAARAGADILELGIPFSDPLADGPTIQRTSFRALEGGMTTRGALQLLRSFREEWDTPVILFTYLNPILRYGVEAFVQDAGDAGAQGILLTDLPVGSDPELEASLRQGGMALVRLLAPTTSPERVARVASEGDGFLYYISRTGVTGSRADLPAQLEEEVRALREVVGLPVAVGFGISTPEQAARVGRVADGVVVGSALMQILDGEGVEAAVAFLSSLVEGMAKGV